MTITTLTEKDFDEFAGIDRAFAAIRTSAEYGERLGAARACRTRFRDHVRAKTRTR